MRQKPSLKKKFPYHPIKQDQWKKYVIHRNQAKFRKQEYNLSFDDYRDFWDTDNKWLNRRIGKILLEMTRKDSTKPWALDNLKIRKKHLN